MASTTPQAKTLVGLVTGEPLRLRRRALSLGIHPDDADDLAQTVLLRAWKSVDAVRDPGVGTVCAWVDAIARNTAVDHLRGRRFTAPLDDSAVEASVAAASVEGEVGARAELTAVLRAIGELPETLRTPLVLSAIEERSGAEIARMLDVDPVVVRQRIRRARVRLAEMLG